MTRRSKGRKSRLLEPIERGQVWRDHPLYGTGEVKVMAFVDDYVIYRRKGAIPGLSHWREFVTKFQAKRIPDIGSRQS